MDKPMKKYRMILDRNACIGAGACVAVDPEHWKIVDDGKADIVGGERAADNGEHSLAFDQDQLSLMRDSVESCPVKAIRIIDQETGETIIS